MLQVVKETYQEKFDRMMKIDKAELVRMLIECNRQLDEIGKMIPPYYICEDKDK